MKLGERRSLPVDKEFLTALGQNNRLEVGRLGVKRLRSGGVLCAELCDVYFVAIPAACSRQNYALFLRDDLNQVEVARVVHYAEVVALTLAGHDPCVVKCRLGILGLLLADEDALEVEVFIRRAQITVRQMQIDIAQIAVAINRAIGG